jgi:mRNA-degrading endonuclease RelE of RelBE toxin-antitoxin system
MSEIRFTASFKSQLKQLAKRYRQIKKDIQPILFELQQDNFIGNQIIGVKQTVFKVRAKNSDIPTGKSGGYRIIYQVVSNQIILLLFIYPNSDQVNITASEIEEIIKNTVTQ